MMVLVFLGILLILLVLDRMTTAYDPSNRVNNAVLSDQTLAYHLDWNVIHDQKFLSYLFVKKVNAVVRYQNLAGVSYDQARKAIEYLLAHPELMPEIPQKRRPALPQPEDQRVHDLLAAGHLEQAITLIQEMLDVDQFTAQQVIERMERELYVNSIGDPDVERLLSKDDEIQAVTMLQKRYGLTQHEAIQAVDMMRGQNQ